MSTEQCSPVSDAMVAARTHSTVHRLLSGAGLADVVAYDLDPDRAWPLLCHGLDRLGQFLVAGVFPAELLDGQIHRVRFDLRKGAPEVHVQLTACSAHSLGDLRVIDAEETDRYLHSGAATAQMLEAAGWPGVRLAVLELEAVHVHDFAGINSVAFDQVARQHHRAVAHHQGHEMAFPLPEDEIVARDVLGEAVEGDLSALARQPRMRWVSTRHHAAPMVDAVGTHVVDIDKTGICVMEVTTHRTRIGLCPFDEAVWSLPALASVLEQWRPLDSPSFADSASDNRR